MIPLWHALSILMKCGAVSTSLFFNFLYIWSYLWCINVLTCIFKRIVASSLYLAQNSHKLSVHMWDWANKCRKVHVTDWLILDEADSLVLDLLIWSNLNPRRRPKKSPVEFWWISESWYNDWALNVLGVDPSGDMCLFQFTFRDIWVILKIYPLHVHCKHNQ